jgi:hypothetical protein
VCCRIQNNEYAAGQYYKILISSPLATDFLVGQAVPPVTAGDSRRLVAALPDSGAALQAADPISSGPAGWQAGLRVDCRATALRENMHNSDVVQ